MRAGIRPRGAYWSRHHRAAAGQSPRTSSTTWSPRDRGDKLTDWELFDQIFTICGAALSATSRAAGGALYTLYSHPDQLAELIASRA